MLSSYQHAMDMGQRFIDADSEFELRAIVGQADPDHAHTMSPDNMYAALTGIMQANVGTLLRMAREQQEALETQAALIENLETQLARARSHAAQARAAADVL